MADRRMRMDEIPTDVALVRRLLAGQFPQWAGLPIEPVPSAGTDNAHLLPAHARTLFRTELDVDDAMWDRGRGWALSVALIQLPYYRDTNPPLAANSRHVIREVLADHPTASAC